jgi:hypothetical protein
VIVTPADPSDFPWLQERSGCGLTDKATAIKAVDEGGDIRGMVGFDGWKPNSVMSHMAVDTPIAWRCLLRAALYYAFVQLERKIVLGTAASDNEKALKVQKRIGFKQVYRVTDGWSDGIDLVLVELRHDSEEAKRWLNGR